MSSTKQDILNIANKICNREVYIGFSNESDIELSLSDLVDNYIQNLTKNQNGSISLIPVLNDIFPTSCEVVYSFYFSLVLLSSLSNLRSTKINDYEDFLINNIINITTNLKESSDSLLNFCADCFSLLFKSNNQLYVQSLRILITSNSNYSRLVLNKIKFPPFQSINDVKDIAINMIKMNSTSPELTAKIFESFEITDPSNIPNQIDVKEINFYQTLVQFLFSIIKNEKSHEKFINIYKNKFHVNSVVIIAQKYFTVSTAETLISDFIQYLKRFKLIHAHNTKFTKELLTNIKPANINQAYDIIRALGAYIIHHIDSSTLNNVIDYIMELTDFCFSSIVVDNSSATSQFVDFINSDDKETHIYPYKKIERLCFYLFFNSNQEMRAKSYDLLFKVSQLFEKENDDWKEYEFSAQPLYRQLNSELSSYNKKNIDFKMDIREFISRSSVLPAALKHVLRRFSNNRSEFCAKIMKECLLIGDFYPFMITLLFTLMTPYLLRQKCMKKIQVNHQSFYNLARSYPEALTMLDTSFLIEYLQFVNDSDIELFVNLTKSGVLNVKSVKTEQLQEQVNVLCKFDRCYNVSLVSQSLLNIVSQLEVIYSQEKPIELNELNSMIFDYLVTNSLVSNLNPLISESFISYSNFLIKNGIEYKICFIESCNLEFFEKVYTKYPSKKEEVTCEALHFIPSIVSAYFLSQNSKSEAASSVKPEITGFILSSHDDELTQLFQSKYPQIKDPSNIKNVINSLNDKQKNVLYLFCLDFIKTPFVEVVGQRCIEMFCMLKNLLPISQIGKEFLYPLYLFFFKHPNISPRDLFFENEEQSYLFFKTFVELGASEVWLSKLLEKCPFSKGVSQKFLTEEWNFIEASGFEKVNENSKRAFKVMVSNEKVSNLLKRSQNLAAYRVYQDNIISDAIENDSLDLEFFASILANNNPKLDYYRVVEFFIVEMTEKIKTNGDHFTSQILNTFFEICTVVIYLGKDEIVRSVYNFVDLVLNDESLKKKLFDQAFVSNIVKFSMIDDSFLGLVTDNKMKVKIPDFINLNDDREVKFWYNAIFRKLDQISSESLDFILSCVSMALEFNSVDMKQRCLMILAVVTPEKQDLNEKQRESVKDFLQFLVLSKNVDEKFGHQIAQFLDESLGPFDLKFTDVDIQVYRSTPEDVREYFRELLSEDDN